MSDNGEIDIVVQGQADGLVGAISQVSDELIEALASAGKLETGLVDLFTKKAPKAVAALTEQVRLLRAEIEKTDNLPSPKSFGPALRTISSGGPAAALRNAQVAGELARIQTDPILAKLAIEKRISKVLEGREEIYRRIRKASGETATQSEVTGAYQAALLSIGDRRQSKEGLSKAKAAKAFLAETKAESQAFEAKIVASREITANKLVAVEKKQNDRIKAEKDKFEANYDRTDANVVDRQEARKGKLAIAEKKRADNKLAEQGKFEANYDRMDASVVDRQETRKAKLTIADKKRSLERIAENEKFEANYDRTDANVVDRQEARKAKLAISDKKRADNKLAEQEKFEANYDRMDANVVDRQEARKGKLAIAEKKLLDNKLAEQERADANYDRMDANAVDRQESRRAKLAIADKKRSDARIAENEKFFSKYQYGEAELQNREFDRNKKAEQKIGPPSIEERAAKSQELQRARQTTGGGLPFLQTQLGSLANYALIGGVISGLALATKGVGDFQDKMSELQAVSRSTDEEMKGLGDTILKVSTTSKFGLSEISDAAITLAQAGKTAEEVAAILPSVLNLASATGTAAGDASKLITSVLTVFNISNDQANKVANTLAQAANTSKLKLPQIATALQYVGVVARTSGVSLEELLASFTAMADSGVKSGSRIGTSMTQMLTQLASPTKKFRDELASLGLGVEDVDVKTQGLVNVLERLKTGTLKTGGLSPQAALSSLGQRAGQGYAALYSGIGGLQAKTDSLSDSDAATKGAEERQRSLKAQTQELSNSFVALANSASGPLVAALTGVSSGLASAFKATQAMGPAIGALVAGLAILATAAAATKLIALAGALLTVASNSGIAAIATSLLTVVMEGNIATLGALVVELALMAAAWALTPFGAITIALTLIAGAMFGASIATKNATEAAEKHTTAMHEAATKATEFKTRADQLQDTINNLTAKSGYLRDGTIQLQNATNVAARAFNSWGSEILKVGDNAITTLGKLERLKIEMLGLEHLKLVAAKGEADKAVNAAHTASAPGRSAIQNPYLLSILTKDGGGANVALRDAIKKVRGPVFDPQDITDVYDAIRASYSQLSAHGKAAAKLWQSAYAKYSGQFTTEGGARANAISTNLSIKSLEKVTSPNGQRIASQAITAAQDAQRRQDTANKISDPKLKLKAQAANSLQSQADVVRLNASAAQDGVTDVLQASDSYLSLKGTLGGTGLADPKDDLKYGKKLLSHATTNAQLDKAANIIHAARSKMSSTTSGGAATALADDADVEDSDDADIQAKRDSINAKGARAGAKATKERLTDSSKLAKLSATGVEDQIKELAYSTNPEDIAKNQPQLTALLARKKAFGRSEITDKSKADKESPAVLEQALKDFDDKSNKEVAKILNGTLEKASTLLADRAQEAADGTILDGNAALRSGSENLTTALGKTSAALNAVLVERVKAVRYKFAAEGKTGSEVEAKVLETLKKGREELIKGLDEHLQASFEGLKQKQAQDRYQFNLAQSASRRQIALGESALGQREIGQAHSDLNAINDRTYQTADAKLNLSQAQGDLAGQQSRKADFLAASTAETQKTLGFQQTMEKFNKEIVLSQENILKLQQVVDGLTIKPDKFNNFSQAFSAAITVLKDQMKPSFYEGLSTGLVGAFQKAQASFGNLISSVLSGSATMGQAIKGFAASVLQSLLDMMAQLIAKKVFSFLLSLVGSKGTGTGTPIDTLVGNRQGGQTKPMRLAQGGGNPNRDSVLGMFMPGEITMQKSAVDMIGADNLLQMNAAGNNQRANVAAAGAARAKPREPDMTNVYVMAPGQQPSLGKNDILAIISDDIMRGGQSKQLIKAVATGGI